MMDIIKSQLKTYVQRSLVMKVTWAPSSSLSSLSSQLDKVFHQQPNEVMVDSIDCASSGDGAPPHGRGTGCC